MLESIFNRSLYIRISPERFSIRDPYTGQEFSDIPEVAIVGNPVAKIVAIGSKARALPLSANGKLVNPFAHPRSLVSDLTTAHQLLKIAVRQEFGKPVFRPLPKVVIHPLGSPAGGFTQIERRALSELAFGVGASKVIVWEGRDLTDAELASGAFEHEDGAESGPGI